MTAMIAGKFPIGLAIKKRVKAIDMIGNLVPYVYRDEPEIAGCKSGSFISFIESSSGFGSIIPM